MEDLKDRITHKGKLFYYVINFGNNRIYGRGKKRLMVNEKDEVERTFSINRKRSLSSILGKA